MNLQTLRQRVDKALKDMQLICENLDIAMRRVQRHQLDLRSFQQALQSDKDAPGASASPACAWHVVTDCACTDVQASHQKQRRRR
jgi:hypothetical protein